MMNRFLQIAAAGVLAVSISAVPSSAQQYSAEPALFMEARLAADEGDYRRSLELLNKVLAKDPTNVIVLFERAAVLAESGRADRAEEALRSLVEKHPDFYDAQKFLGRLLLESSANEPQRLGAALVHLHRAFKLRPDDLATGLTVAQILMAQNRNEEAAKVLATLLEESPDNRSVNFTYGQVLTKLGRGDESRPYYEKVLVSDPQFGPAISQLVDIYEKSNEFRKAAEILDPLIAIDPLNMELQRQQGLYYLRAGQSEKARQRFEAAVKADPKEQRSRYFLAEALSDLGELKRAEQIYRELLREKPADPELLISLGMNLGAQRRFDEAEELFTTIANDTRLTDHVRRSADTQIAMIEHQRANYDKALSHALGIINDAKQPTYQAISIALDVYRRRESWKEGLALLEPLVTKYPTDKIIQTRYTEFLLRADDPRGAETANALRKTGRREAISVAELYAQLERYEESARVLNDLAKENPQDVDILFQLGSVYERAGKIKDAEKAFLSVLEQNEEHAPTLNYLGYMWADRGENLQRAAEMLTTAVQIEPRNGAYLDSLGWVHFKLGNLELAERYLLDAAGLVPRDPTIQSHLGDLFAKRGEHAKALERYQEALKLEPEDEDEQELRTKISELEKNRSADSRR